MRISFDLDDTLICYQPHVPREPPLGVWARWLVRDEPLRLGARQLLNELRGDGHEIWIYTTSFRPPASVRWWLRLHGVRIDEVINEQAHERQVRRANCHPAPSKHPRLFGIDLHVDDSLGVKEEGDRFGFRVVVISPDDPHWTAAVLDALRLSG